MKKTLLFLCVLLCCGLLLSPAAFRSGADFGDFAGDDDYGDYDGYDGYDDYDGGSGSGGGSGGFADTAVTLVIVVIIVIWAVASGKGKKTAVSAAPASPVPSSLPALAPLDSYREADPAFSEEMLRDWVATAYVRLQRAWQLRDLSSVRPLLSDELAARTETQLDAYRQAGRTNMIDRIAVLEVAFLGWRRDGDRDVIVARVCARIRDWQVDDRTGAVIAGDPSRDKVMQYLWTLGRSAGVRTESEEPGVVADVCPNCGAPLNLNRSAVCEYCRSVIRSSRYDWVLTSVEGLSQRTL